MSAVAEFLEAAMLICFGVSWPVSAVQAWGRRTATGTSPLFMALITAGYVFGIAAELVTGRIT